MSKPPLDGIRVADFCWAWAGPYGALHFAHLGAEVIRVESNTRMCPTRHIPPWPNNERGINRSGYFNQYNQGKRSLNLDLKKLDGIALAKQLVAKSDIVIRRPSKMSSMPQGLIDVLSEDEVLDLIAYIRSAGNPKDPAFATGPATTGPATAKSASADPTVP